MKRNQPHVFRQFERNFVHLRPCRGVSPSESAWHRTVHCRGTPLRPCLPKVPDRAHHAGACRYTPTLTLISMIGEPPDGSQIVYSALHDVQLQTVS